MSIPPDTAPSTLIRWVGQPYVDTVGEVKPGDLGTFIDFDGPAGHPEAVVTFPDTGAFVCSTDQIEVVSD